MARLTLALMALLAVTLVGCKKKEVPQPQVLWPQSWEKTIPAIMIEELSFDAKTCTVRQTQAFITVECRLPLNPGGTSKTDSRMIMPPGACGVGDDGFGHVISSTNCDADPHGGMEP